MAKKSHIALELKSLDNKIQELRDYLDNTKIKSIADDDKRHAEIKVQLLILEKLGPIVSIVHDLRSKDEEDKGKASEAIRGDAQLSPLEEGLI